MRKLLCILCVLMVIFPMMASANTALSNSTTYTINNVTISATSVSDPGWNQCWAYVNYLYKMIWKKNFSSDFFGSATSGLNILKWSK